MVSFADPGQRHPLVVPIAAAVAIEPALPNHGWLTSGRWRTGVNRWQAMFSARVAPLLAPSLPFPFRFPLALMLVGCEFNLPSAPFLPPTTTIHGKVTLAGEPVTTGWIAFHPRCGTVGDHVIVPLQADGSFEARGAPIGSLQVRIDLPERIERDWSARSPMLAERFPRMKGPGAWLSFASTSGANECMVDLAATPLTPPK